jgi:hypothetical protein
VNPRKLAIPRYINVDHSIVDRLGVVVRINGEARPDENSASVFASMIVG